VPFRPHQDADAAVAPKKAPFPGATTPPVGEDDEAPPTPRLSQLLEKKQNREMNEAETA
jgi:hypothetical protein